MPYRTSGNYPGYLSPVAEHRHQLPPPNVTKLQISWNVIILKIIQLERHKWGWLRPSAYGSYYGEVSELRIEQYGKKEGAAPSLARRTELDLQDEAFRRQADRALLAQLRGAGQQKTRISLSLSVSVSLSLSLALALPLSRSQSLSLSLSLSLSRFVCGVRFPLP